LNAASRNTFHTSLRTCCDLLQFAEPSNTSFDESDQEEYSRDENKVIETSKRDTFVQPATPDPTIASPKGEISIQYSFKTYLYSIHKIRSIEVKSLLFIL
jgi:hypothetical protein